MASTLKLGNGNWGVKEDSLLAYSDKNNNFLPLPFDFSRASSATVVNKAGLIETVGSGEPRIDFKDDAKGALLLEPQSTNLIVYSEDFSDSSWNAVTDVIIDKGYLAPDGSMNATKVTVSGVNPKVALLSGNGSKSIYARTVSGTGTAYFAGQNGVEVISNVTEQWQRFEVNNSPLDNFYAVDFRGASTLTEVIIWGAQRETLPYPTSYIPTQGSSSTRIAEICNNSGSAQDFNDSEGVLYGEFSTNNTDSPNWLNISDTSAVNWLFLGKQDGYIRVYLRANDSVILDYTKPLEDKNKIALSYKSGDIKVYINGVNVDNSTNTFSFTSALSRIDFNQYSGGGTQTQIAWKAITVFNTALTDEELIELTKI
jgi:hypothetical protein